MDEMAFLEPVRVGDPVQVKAQVSWTGWTPMEVGVRVLAQIGRTHRLARRRAIMDLRERRAAEGFED